MAGSVRPYLHGISFSNSHDQIRKKTNIYLREYSRHERQETIRLRVAVVKEMPAKANTSTLAHTQKQRGT